MRKFIRALLAILLVAFIVLQFFQPEKTTAEITSDHLFKQQTISKNIQVSLNNACMDCHSDQTRYLWYHHISPVSWMVSKHIEEGKDELNFSDWGKLDIYDKIEMVEEICSEVERSKMPLESYTVMHPRAKLSDEQKAELCAWTEKMGMELLSTLKNQKP